MKHTYGWNDKKCKTNKTKKVLTKVVNKENQIMSAITNLNDSVVALKAQVDLLVANGQTNSEQAIQVAADSVNAETARIKAVTV